MERIDKAIDATTAALRAKTCGEYWQSVKESVKPLTYRCPLCTDTGWILERRDDGLLVAVPCECQADRRQERLVDMSRLSESDLRLRLSDCWNANTRAAAERVLSKFGWLTVTGPFGVGKSFLLKAAVNEARISGKTALYITMADLLQHLRESFDPETQTMSYSKLWLQIAEAQVLAVDEVDRYNATSWAEAELFRLVNERYTHWRDRATLWAMNDFDAVVGYLRDRMTDGRFQMLIMDHDSVRPRLRA